MPLGIPSNADEDIPAKLEFKTTPDGSTGITTRMTILSDGKVGIGEVAPAYQLEVRNSSGDCDITVNCSADSDASLKLGEEGKEAYGRVRYDANTDMLFLYSNNGIRQVIDSAGKVGIGTTDPDMPLEISHSDTTAINAANIGDNSAASGIHIDHPANTDNAGCVLKFSTNSDACQSAIAHIQQDANDSDLVFYTENSGTLTEGFRLDSNNNVGIGTVPSYPLHVEAGSPNHVVHFENSNSNDTSDVLWLEMGHGSPANGGHWITFADSSDNIHGAIRGDGAGGIDTYDASDYRIKENIEPIPDGLSLISSLKPKTFNYIGNNIKKYGFIAHEFGEVLPTYVQGEKDEVKEDLESILNILDKK